MHTPSFYRIYGLPLFVQRFLVMLYLATLKSFFESQILYETGRILNLWSISVFTARSESISQYSKDLKYFKS